MSLINEALKKAQRQRTTVADVDDGAAADGRVRKRAAPMGAQTMILVAAAAIALVVCSVVLTVYLLTRKPAEPARAVVAAAVPKPPSVDLTAPSPVIVAPVVPAAAAVVPAEPAPTPPTRPAGLDSKPAGAASAAAPTPVATPVPAVPSTAPAAAAAPVTVKPATNLPPDPRILQFVDAIKVTGIRSSGTDSKVLMNDRVFRVNEIVERTLDVRLVKVASDALTFEDANGVIYTKTF